jgi:hypothetical protein
MNKSAPQALEQELVAWNRLFDYEAIHRFIALGFVYLCESSFPKCQKKQSTIARIEYRSSFPYPDFYIESLR